MSELTEEEAQGAYVRLVTEVEPEWNTGAQSNAHGTAASAVFSRPVIQSDDPIQSNAQDGHSQVSPDRKTNIQGVSSE